MPEIIGKNILFRIKENENFSGGIVKYNERGIIAAKLTPFSFVRQVIKKTKHPNRHQNQFPDSLNFRKIRMDINPNKKTRISSRFFKLATTSV